MSEKSSKLLEMIKGGLSVRQAAAEIGGWAGFPYYGLERRAHREAIKRMTTGLGKFDRVILGHWHAPLCHPYYWIGGSLSGTDAYDHGQGRHAAPSQAAWMVHPRHGEFDRTDFDLEVRK